MDNGFSHLPQTDEALNDLDRALTQLQLVLESKRNKLGSLKNCAQQSVIQIDALIEKINKACESNGSGNNHY